jgi:hypothetical protein
VDESVDPNDPFDAHYRREPLAGAGIRIVLLTESSPETAVPILAPVVAWLEKEGRCVEVRTMRLDPREGRRNDALQTALEGAALPLVLVTTAEESCTDAHLAPLLAAIDHCDHAVGKRPLTSWQRIGRWIGSLPRRIVFAVPVVDVHSPCQLHRREKLAAIPLQSRSSFLDVEILAKATFLTHLLKEVDVPPLCGWISRKGWLTDLAMMLRRPHFKRPEPAPISGPAKEAEGQVETADGPGDQDRDGQEHVVVQEVRSLQQDQAKGIHELGERQGLDNILSTVGKPLGAEEDAREQVHRQHDQVHQPAHGFRGAGPAGDEQSDPGERERSDDIDQKEHEQIAADRHVKDESAQEQEHADVRDQEGQTRGQHSAQEVAPGHGSGHVTLEQLTDAKVHQEETDAPETSSHGVEPDQTRNQEINIT